MNIDQISRIMGTSAGAAILGGAIAGAIGAHIVTGAIGAAVVSLGISLWAAFHAARPSSP
jgi:uncharacterized membrane protein